MTDHLFAATLTFALLAGGTIAIGSELMGAQRSSGAARPTAHAAPLQVTLPTVTVIGRRPASTAVAAAARVGQPQRVQ